MQRNPAIVGLFRSSNCSISRESGELNSRGPFGLFHPVRRAVFDLGATGAAQTIKPIFVDEVASGDNSALWAGSVGACRHVVGMSSLTRAELGALGEQVAVEHLAALGLKTLARNWRCRYGELDIIAEDAATGTVVFVEVKTRSGDGFGGLAEAVTPQKVRRIRRLAAIWLAAQDAHWAVLRIDVIGVRVGRSRDPEIVHLAGVG